MSCLVSYGYLQVRAQEALLMRASEASTPSLTPSSGRSGKGKGQALFFLTFKPATGWFSLWKPPENVCSHAKSSGKLRPRSQQWSTRDSPSGTWQLITPSGQCGCPAPGFVDPGDCPQPPAAQSAGGNKAQCFGHSLDETKPKSTTY